MWTAVAGALAGQRLLAAREAADSLRGSSTLDVLQDDLRAADGDLGTAQHLLGGWTGAGPALVARLPLVGRTLAAARAAADAGRSLTTTGVEVLAALDGRSPFAGQGLDVAAATDVAEALERGQAASTPPSPRWNVPRRRSSRVRSRAQRVRRSERCCRRRRR